MVGKHRILGTLVFLAFFPWLPARAGEAKIHTFDSFDFLKKGEVKGVTVSDDGVLRQGPVVSTLWQTDAPYVWGIAVDPSGNLFFAAGASGGVYRYEPKGKTTCIFETDEAFVTAIAAAKTGEIYAGTSPQAKIYRIAPNEDPQMVVDLPDTYVWALRFDNAGNLWIATGERARLYRLGTGGRLDTVLAADEAHLRCLVPYGRGWLAGSADDGYVYQIEPDGNYFVLWDAPLEEVVAIAPIDEASFLVATLGRATPAPQQKESSSEVASRLLSAIRTKKQKSQVYLVNRNGATRKLWDSTDEQALCAIPRSGDPHEFLVGTGPEGKIYSLSANGRKAIVASVDPSYVVSLVPEGKDVLVATANPGRALKLNFAEKGEGKYLCPVFDAKLVSRWGALQWREDGRGKVRFYTRSGNTKEPDESWSDWEGPLVAGEGTHVPSPPARFLQWRVEISGDESFAVREISLSYRQENAAPVLKAVKIYPPNVVYSGAAKVDNYKRAGQGQGLTSVKSLGERKTQQGYRTCSWDFTDPNGDRLVFRLEVRRQDWESWRLLGDAMMESAFALDTRTLPDGYYRFRVTASDSPSNPRNQAKTATLESKEFLVDHTPPRIRKLSAKRSSANCTLSFEAWDELSRLRNAEISIGSGPWEKIAPQDGILDSKTETFQLQLGELKSGMVVSVRVADEFGNTSYGWIEMP